MTQWLYKLAFRILPVSLLRKRLKLHTCNTNSTNNKQLLIDVSAIAKIDAKTGIQRVVRNLYQQLLLAPPEGYQVCPVMATRKQFYRHIPTDFLQHAGLTPATTPIHIRAGDIFLGLDLSAHLIPHHLPELWTWKKQGVRMTFVIYDLLPVLHPQWFNPKATQNFHEWLRALAWLANGAVGISRTVQADFNYWMQRYGLNESDIPCTVIPLGAELDATLKEDRIRPVDSTINLEISPYILMVGTLEPRKGYDDALAAFEALWATGDPTPLVIVGKQGWKVEALAHQLQTHSEAGKRLLWLDNADDSVLRTLYQQCQGVLIASRGEGYGLPLMEAAYFHKPVLVRDIPVFREIADNNVTFFPDSSASDLHEALAIWIDALASETNSSSSGFKYISWQESCAQLLKILFHTKPS
ncbi:MAG: glycosyltransferase family 4 protein [Burkholderiales bacterium]